MPPLAHCGCLTEPKNVWDSAKVMPLEKLTRARLVAAFNLLGELAEQEQVTLELCLYGGSAMMLAYSARETTKDVDVIARPSDVALRLAAVVDLRSVEQVQEHLERFYPDEVLTPKLKEIVQSLLAEKGDQDP